MNANELADRLESDDRLWFVNEDLMVKTCAMLRQQQAEIDKLKNLLLDNQMLLDKTLNHWAKEMERKK